MTLKKTIGLMVIALATVFAIWAGMGTTAFAENSKRTVTDFRGVQVELPAQINRVVTIDDGLTEAVITLLGESQKIVGLGSRCLQRASKYSIPGVQGKEFSRQGGMNPVRLLNPNFKDLPLVKDSSTGPNLETLAGLNPDVVIIRMGSCSASWDESEQTTKRNMRAIESLGFPVVMLYAPPVFDDPDLSRIPKEIEIIGQIFGQEEKAGKAADAFQQSVAMIKERTQDVPDGEKPIVLALGLSPLSRKAGGTGNVRGGIIQYYIEGIANAKSAYTVNRFRSDNELMNTEQLFALNPDIIILPTSSGYHPPEELYSAPYYQNLQELMAVKNRKVSALPYMPCNCDASRLEAPIDLMIIAKTAYPDRFSDIKVHEWVLDFYQKIYGVNKDTATRLRSAQWLDWMVEADF